MSPAKQVPPRLILTRLDLQPLLMQQPRRGIVDRVIRTGSGEVEVPPRRSPLSQTVADNEMHPSFLTGPLVHFVCQEQRRQTTVLGSSLRSDPIHSPRTTVTEHQLGIVSLDVGG